MSGTPSKRTLRRWSILFWTLAGVVLLAIGGELISTSHQGRLTHEKNQERIDVDALYQAATAFRTSRNGQWPLTVGEVEPFYVRKMKYYGTECFVSGSFSELRERFTMLVGKPDTSAWILPRSVSPDREIICVATRRDGVEETSQEGFQKLTGKTVPP